MLYKIPKALNPDFIATRIQEPIRERIAEVAPDCTEGVFMLRFANKSEISSTWLGLPLSGNTTGNVIIDPASGAKVCEGIDGTDLDFVFSATPGGRKTRSASWRPADEITDGQPREDINCAGMVHFMVEGCARAVIGGYGCRSDDLPDDQLICGVANNPGAICMNLLLQQAQGSDELIARIYAGAFVASDAENRAIINAVPDLLKGIFYPFHQHYPNRLTLTFPPVRI